MLLKATTTIPEIIIHKLLSIPLESFWNWELHRFLLYFSGHHTIYISCDQVILHCVTLLYY